MFMKRHVLIVGMMLAGLGLTAQNWPQDQLMFQPTALEMPEGVLQLYSTGYFTAADYFPHPKVRVGVFYVVPFISGLRARFQTEIVDYFNISVGLTAALYNEQYYMKASFVYPDITATLHHGGFLFNASYARVSNNQQYLYSGGFFFSGANPFEVGEWYKNKGNAYALGFSMPLGKTNYINTEATILTEFHDDYISKLSFYTLKYGFQKNRRSWELGAALLNDGWGLIPLPYLGFKYRFDGIR